MKLKYFTVLMNDPIGINETLKEIDEILLRES